MPPLAPQVLAEGRLFEGRWRILRCLRVGGMGAVYEVVHIGTLAKSALKLLRPELVTSSELRQRFRQEAMVTATMESDHIVKVFDSGTDAETGAPFLVMELLRGEDLAARVERGPLSAEEVVVLLGQASLALERTHAAGVVHRDLKPANLFVTKRDDGSPCLKVLDYGIAKIVASTSHAETTRAVGTPLYMAPEQVKGDGGIAPPADLYALAQIAFTLLVGEAYWATDQGEGRNVYPLLMAIAAGVNEPASERAARAGVKLPLAFDPWFARATAIAPEARFSDARAMIAALAPALGLSAPTMMTSAPEVDRASHPAASATVHAPLTVGGLASDSLRTPGRSRVLVGTGVAVAAVLGLLGWSAFTSGMEGGASADVMPAKATIIATAMTTATALSLVPVASAPASSELPAPSSSMRPVPSSPSSEPRTRLPSARPSALTPSTSREAASSIPAPTSSDPSDQYYQGTSP